MARNQVALFARDGVVLVRGVLGPHQVAPAEDAIEQVLARPGPRAQVASDGDDPGRFVEDFCRWTEIPAIEQLARRSRVPQVAAELMATPRVRLYHDHVLVKRAARRGAPRGTRTSRSTTSTGAGSAPGSRWDPGPEAAWRSWPAPTAGPG